MKTLIEKDKLKILYFQVADLWKKLCEEHSSLFDLTCEEYSCLLGSELDAIEDKVKQKENIILNIASLDKLRLDLIEDINSYIKNEEDKIQNVSGLLDLMLGFESEKNEKHLHRFNELLIDIIEKIRKQNKDNQIFINKALRSLEEIRHEAGGIKNYKTYDSKGITRNPGRV